MGILYWDKVKKALPTAEHNARNSSDCGVPGTFVPNMSEKDRYRWKATVIRGKNPRVEIRKAVSGKSPVDGSGTYAQILIVVFPYGEQVISMNGKALIDVADLADAVQEARAVLNARVPNPNYQIHT